MSDRPRRRAITIASKRTVAANQGGICLCGCATPIWTGERCNVQWDHEPALRLRDVLPDGSDYTPAQNDPSYIVARCRASHDRKTRGSGATTAGTDVGKIKKERKREREARDIERPKRKWGAGRGFPPKGSRPMKGRKK